MHQSACKNHIIAKSDLPPALHRARGNVFARLLAIAVFTVTATDVQAVHCDAESPAHRVALLELYTSEGCNSCPPADRWLNSLQDRGTGSDEVVPLAFHVDYWDYIGWQDRFAHPDYARRQRLIAKRSDAAFVYTPQFILNGRDIRRPWLSGELKQHLARINADRSHLHISVSVDADDRRAELAVAVRHDAAHDAHLYVALFENGLSSEITRGENAGKRLYHEHVVRQFAGPVLLVPGTSTQHRFRLDLTGYDAPSRMGIAIFAEAAGSGTTLQALAMPLCTDP